MLRYENLSIRACYQKIKISPSCGCIYFYKAGGLKDNSRLISTKFLSTNTVLWRTTEKLYKCSKLSNGNYNYSWQILQFHELLLLQVKSILQHRRPRLPCFLATHEQSNQELSQIGENEKLQKDSNVWSLQIWNTTVKISLSHVETGKKVFYYEMVNMIRIKPGKCWGKKRFAAIARKATQQPNWPLHI